LVQHQRCPRPTIRIWRANELAIWCGLSRRDIFLFSYSVPGLPYFRDSGHLLVKRRNENAGTKTPSLSRRTSNTQI
jgi:hypothetical protein